MEDDEREFFEREVLKKLERIETQLSALGGFVERVEKLNEVLGNGFTSFGKKLDDLQKSWEKSWNSGFKYLKRKIDDLQESQEEQYGRFLRRVRMETPSAELGVPNRPEMEHGYQHGGILGDRGRRGIFPTLKKRY